jgi:hypothetical protein
VRFAPTEAQAARLQCHGDRAPVAGDVLDADAAHQMRGTEVRAQPAPIDRHHVQGDAWDIGAV